MGPLRNALDVNFQDSYFLTGFVHSLKPIKYTSIDFDNLNAILSHNTLRKWKFCLSNILS